MRPETIDQLAWFWLIGLSLVEAARACRYLAVRYCGWLTGRRTARQLGLDRQRLLGADQIEAEAQVLRAEIRQAQEAMIGVVADTGTADLYRQAIKPGRSRTGTHK